MKAVREKETRALSLPATAGFTGGVGLWLIYGLAIHDWPLIGSNAVTLGLMAVILGCEAALRLRERAGRTAETVMGRAACKKICGPGRAGSAARDRKGCTHNATTTEAIDP